uniref:Ecdysone-induced protein 74EF-like n=1 Tax=Crassostrea virginica TaxID=6565 RepID=A0A8B8CGT2_CRAVI|nr:ecdysone-induced protein 74EF-like [Crassostrea virginica]
MPTIESAKDNVFSESSTPSCQQPWSADEHQDSHVLFDWHDVTTHIQHVLSAESGIKNYETLNMTVQNGSGSDAMVEINGVVYPVDIRADLGTLPDKLLCSDRQNENQLEDGYCKSHTTEKKQRTCRLWEFLRDLLCNPQYNPEVIKWSNREKGEFKLVKSGEIAKMWGIRKNNNGMTYEKLSRALRYYYKTKVLLPVLGKRLMYQFGPSSYGWQ